MNIRATWTRATGRVTSLPVIIYEILKTNAVTVATHRDVMNCDL